MHHRYSFASARSDQSLSRAHAGLNAMSSEKYTSSTLQDRYTLKTQLTRLDVVIMLGPHAHQ
jgi:hypothetical protein